MPAIALATSEKWAALSPDDLPLVPALARAGIDAEPAIWSDPSVDWDRFAAVVIRSCWDYHLRRDAFLHWIATLQRPLFNPPRVVAWNSHKSYLLELAARGVRIPRTELIRQPLSAIDGEIIIKPAVSASAHDTHRVSSAAEARTISARLLERGDAIVQEFVGDITTLGEWSMIFLDRQFSHAVKKLPKRGDFRVQQELGGSADLAEAPQHVIEAARSILRLVDGDVLYARVDVIDREGGVTLMELELIEPMLFLQLDARAPLRFAEAIARRLL